MKLRFGDQEGKVFETNKGSPQGDAISGVFFNIAFENALHDLRATMNQINIKIEHSYSKQNNLTEELIYGDDTDFPTDDSHKNKEIQQVANPILKTHSLKVNDNKWEKTEIIRSTEYHEEKWRKTRKLGSLLGDYEDMKRRIQLSNLAMDQLTKVWPENKIHITRKLKIYKSIVKSILTYNMCTWGLTKAQQEELNRGHRKQLRRVFNDPNIKQGVHPILITQIPDIPDIFLTFST